MQTKNSVPLSRDILGLSQILQSERGGSALIATDIVRPSAQAEILYLLLWQLPHAAPSKVPRNESSFQNNGSAKLAMLRQTIQTIKSSKNKRPNLFAATNT